ncbi:siderophore-interacting protein [Sphingobacterium sp. WM]|uniref:siderophore-interacting protein n=1 Tax=Sphingobacterium sp. WM TaxID=3031802 RepID=UPI00240D3034|nr:siderophore-interacting protein [Sphingobacterium sp. WM]WFB64961.1 siderophore-interacting protein [Sphingobacterium sp. WM]
MPQVPKWMTDAMESLFKGTYHSVKITTIKYISPSLKYIRFKGDFSRIKNDFIPGNVIEFRISDRDFRHYTPSYFNLKKGICDVIFYINGKGPGSIWADNLALDDELKIMGPSSKMNFNYSASSHVVFGDETSLGLMQHIHLEAKKQGKPCCCLIEINPNHLDWLDHIRIDFENIVVLDSSTAGIGQSTFKEWLLNQRPIQSEMEFYLTGNASSIQKIQKDLISNGYSKKQIQTYPYWAQGKVGL